MRDQIQGRMKRINNQKKNYKLKNYSNKNKKNFKISKKQ